MKTLKLLLFAVLTISLVTCRTENENQKNKFDYTMYENRTNLYNVLNKMNLKKANKVSGRMAYDPYLNSIETLNNEFQTSLEFTNFDQYLIDNQNVDPSTYEQNGYMSQRDYDLVNTFFTDLNTYNFDTSINRLESNILALNLSQEEFAKYNLFVNSLLVINDYYQSQGYDIFDETTNTSVSRRRISPGCAWALAGNAISTVGLNTCLVPNPACGWAIAGKVVSLIGIYYSCP